MKFLVFFFFVYTFSSAIGQFAARGSFAGSLPKGDIYSDVHPMHRSTEASVSGDSGNLANRNALGEDGATSTSTKKAVNVEEVYMTWPRENRPYDVINRAQIEKQLYPERQQTTRENTVQSKGSFQGEGTVSVTSKQLPNVDVQENHHHHHHHDHDETRNVNYNNVKQLKSSNRESY